LLDQLAPESSQGSRFERLRHSKNLWLQLFAILLFTWLLCQPRWVRSDSLQNVVIVLDSSASMSAFATQARHAIAEKSRMLAAAAANTEWTLIESLPNRKKLYVGPNREEMLASFANWHPDGGGHDIEASLRTAMGIAHGKGLVVLVTDRLFPIPTGVDRLAVGFPIENLGFTGLQADAKGWRVLVRNFGSQPARRVWKIDGRPQGTLELAPGAMSELRGGFPSNVEQLVLTLEADAFTLDDSLPFVRPAPKTIGIFCEEGTPFDAFFRKFAATIPGSRSDSRDLSLMTFDSVKPGTGSCIAVVDHAGLPRKLLSGRIVAENHPLVEGLNWQQLLVSETASMVLRESDDVLLSQGARPLIVLRYENEKHLFVVNFDLRHSNALQLPSFVLALNRFVEFVRADLPYVESINAELGQELSNGERAPDVPGFFDRARVRGAAHFADAREADFREAASGDSVSGLAATLKLTNTEQDFLMPLWTLALIGICLATWKTAFGGKRTGEKAE